MPLLRVRIADPVRLVDHDDAASRASGAPSLASSLFFARVERLLLAGGGASSDFVFSKLRMRHALGRRPRAGDRPPPLRDRALRADHQHVLLRHVRDRDPGRQGLAEAGQVAEQEARPALAARGQDRRARRSWWGRGTNCKIDSCPGELASCLVSGLRAKSRLAVDQSPGRAVRSRTMHWLFSYDPAACPQSASACSHGRSGREDGRQEVKRRHLRPMPWRGTNSSACLKFAVGHIGGRKRNAGIDLPCL